MAATSYFLQVYLAYYVIYSIQNDSSKTSLKNQNVDYFVAVSRVVGTVVLYIYCGQAFGDNLVMYLQWHIFYKTYYNAYQNKRCKLFGYLIFHMIITTVHISICVVSLLLVFVHGCCCM